jgi:hypothetical protein
MVKFQVTAITWRPVIRHTEKLTISALLLNPEAAEHKK